MKLGKSSFNQISTFEGSNCSFFEKVQIPGKLQSSQQFLFRMDGWDQVPEMTMMTKFFREFSPSFSEVKI